MRGQRGETAGFLQQGGGILRCKARCDGIKRAKLTLCFEEGVCRELELELDGNESEWPDDGWHKIVCAYVSAEGELLLATDERGRQAFERDRNRARREAIRLSDSISEKTARGREQNAQGKACDTDERENTCAEHVKRAQIPADETVKTCNAVRQNDAQTSRTLPEGRWPPPPCRPEARYQMGKWVDIDEEARESKVQP